MNRVTATFGFNFPQKRHTKKSQVADDVEDFVADEFVLKSEQRLVEHSVFAQEHRILERAAEREVGFAEHFDFLRETKRARARDFADERAV